MKIGVLAAQGAFAEHVAVLRLLGAETQPVRLPEELAGLDGLIIPGGESSSISKLMLDYGLRDGIIKLAKNNLPMFGTCAGMILLASEITDGNQVKPLGLMNIKVKRNAFGRQRESFETDITVPALGENTFPGVFIRAPLIEESNSGVEVLARLPNGTVVAARQGILLAAAFHPELTDDTRFHKYFLDIVAGQR